jgi:hypothetical protein
MFKVLSRAHVPRTYRIRKLFRVFAIQVVRLHCGGRATFCDASRRIRCISWRVLFARVASLPSPANCCPLAL